MFGLLSAVAAFAAVASAAPAQHGDFTMLMQHIIYPYPTIFNSSLVLTHDNGTGQHWLVAHDPAKHPGTPARASAYNTYYTANLSMIQHGKEYFLSTIDAAEVYGIHSPVSGDLKYAQPKWDVGEYVYHQLTAASNSLMACNTTVNGKTELVLSFGDVTQAGNDPEDCELATVFTKFFNKH